MIWPLSRAAPIARKFAWLRRASESRPSRPASSFNTPTFFEIPKILRALPVRDVIRTPSPCSPSRAMVTSLSDTSALRSRVLAPASSLHLTNRKVLSLTKPKGMNRNPSAIILHLETCYFWFKTHLLYFICVHVESNSWDSAWDGVFVRGARSSPS